MGGVCACVHVCVNMCVCACVCKYVCVCMYVSVHVYWCVHLSVQLVFNVFTYVHARECDAVVSLFWSADLYPLS